MEDDHIPTPYSPLRYPGGKTRLFKHLCPPLMTWTRGVETFVDLFAGGGSVSIGMARQLPDANIVMNDADPAVANFWRCVVDPRTRSKLIELVASTPILHEERVLTCRDLMNHGPSFQKAFFYLVVNRTKFSGNLTGGWMKNLNSRWNATRLAGLIHKMGNLLEGRTAVTCMDCVDLLRHYGRREDALVYADPPYVKKGSQLYRHSFKESDHVRFAQAVSQTTCSILISYDNEEVVRQLYVDMPVTFPCKVKASYSVSSNGHRPRKTEVLVRRGNPANVYRAPMRSAEAIERLAGRILPWNDDYKDLITKLWARAAEVRNGVYPCCGAQANQTISTSPQ